MMQEYILIVLIHKFERQCKEWNRDYISQQEENKCTCKTNDKESLFFSHKAYTMKPKIKNVLFKFLGSIPIHFDMESF